jgi:hypothetical protein
MVWGFEELLGVWPSERRQDTNMWVTKVFDSYLKCNVAIGLAGLGKIVIKGPNCCLSCAIMATVAENHGDDGDSGDAYLHNSCVIGFHPHYGTVSRR